MQTILLSALFFILGTILGSFVNVLVDRTKKNQSIISKRSYCDFCKKQLLWQDLIPILSYFTLSGKCRFCHKKLSIQYPNVEFLAGILTAGAFIWQFSLASWNPSQINFLALTYYIITFNLLLATFLSDIKYGLIFDRIVLWGIISTFVYLLIGFIGSELDFYLYLASPNNQFGKYLIESGYFINNLVFDAIPLFWNLAAAFIAGLFFLLLVIVTKGRGMGGGDVKLVFWLGLAIGMPKILVMVFLAFLSGAIFAIILIILRLKKFGQTIPFGPFLVIAAIAAIIFGDLILKYYLNNLGFLFFN